MSVNVSNIKGYRRDIMGGVIALISSAMECNMGCSVASFVTSKINYGCHKMIMSYSQIKERKLYTYKSLTDVIAC